MSFIIGFTLALIVCAYLATTRMDRDRAAYSVMVVVVASYYVLFAVQAGDATTVASESLITIVFAVAAAIGFRGSAWLTASALAGHGLLDGVHGLLVHNPGVPAWWPAFCAAFDVTAGAWMMLTLVRRRHPLGATR